MSFPRYPAYKPSGVEWLGEVPEHWSLKPVFGVASQRDEDNKGMKEDNLLSLSYGNIVNKDINTSDGLLPESFETYQIVRPGDIVLRLTDLQNDKRSLRSALVTQTGIITSAYLTLESERIDSKFLNYLLRAYDVSKVFYSMGGGLRQSMKYADIKRMPLVIPAKAEQLAIATFLDHETAKIDALIAEQQRLIGLLQEKRQSVISHAVTKGLNPDAPMKDSGVEWLGEVPEHWDVKSCRNIASIGRGASPRPAGDSRYFGGDFIPWVTVAEITKDCSMGLCSTEQYLTEEGAANSTVFSSGTVIYSNSGATLGVPKILKIDCCANDGVVGFRGLDLSLRPEFLYHFLWQLTDSIREWAKQGQGQPNLNTDIIKSIKIPLPPLEEQVDILRKLDEDLFVFDSLVSEADKAQLLLGERRSALISAAVTGQIDVRGLVPEAVAA